MKDGVRCGVEDGVRCGVKDGVRCRVRRSWGRTVGTAIAGTAAMIWDVLATGGRGWFSLAAAVCVGSGGE